MKLGFETIRDITVGAARVLEEDGVIRFRRLTEAQEANCRTAEEDFLYPRSLASAGVKLSFFTDAQELTLRGDVLDTGTRDFYAIDLFVDGKYLADMTNVPRDRKNVISAGEGAKSDYSFGAAEGSFRLGKGRKKVTLYLPYSVEFCLRELSLSDGASVTPAREGRSMLIYGDSITQGFDVRHPSAAYAVRLAESLGADAINKAIGGDKLRPDFLALRDDLSPDYITLAYGTNDWASGKTRERIAEELRACVLTLREGYPDAKIFVLSPIIRLRREEITGVAFPFEELVPLYRETLSDLANVYVIDGTTLVPENAVYFADYVLHPNDSGSLFYHGRLHGIMRSLLNENNTLQGEGK